MDYSKSRPEQKPLFAGTLNDQAIAPAPAEAHNRSPLFCSANLFFSITLAIFCSLMFWLSEPRFYADTANYALHITEHWSETSAPGADPLWDFGHVLWRPFGYSLWKLAGGPVSSDPLLQAARTLIGISITFWFLGLVLFYRLCANYTSKPWAAFAATFGLFATHAALNYAKAGTSYVPGMVCQIAALYWLEKQLRQGDGERWSAGLMAGLFLGFAITFWFPYCLTTPAVLVFALLYRSGSRSARAVLILRSAAACALFVFAIYAIAIAANHITSLDLAHQWYLRSQYGKSQTRGYLRVLTGLPRSFFWLGDTGVLWKRLLFRNGLGAHGLSAVWLIGQIAWKLFAVYAFILLLMAGLARVRTARMAVLVLVTAAGPILFFAIVLFEAGPPERYLPVFPMLFLCVAHLLGAVERRFYSIGAVCFIGIMLSANGFALNRFSSHSRWARTTAKISALTQLSSPNDLLILVSFQDDINRMLEERPFDPLMRRLPRTYVAAELQSSRTLTWRGDVARLVLETWKTGHQIWISKRLLASHPKPEWNWVEGDDARIRWADLPAYFSRLQPASDCCGEDGFVLLDQSPENIKFLGIN